MNHSLLKDRSPVLWRTPAGHTSAFRAGWVLAFVLWMMAALSVVGGTVTRGYWTFDDGNLSAQMGNDLQFVDPTLTGRYAFGTTTELGIPDINGKAARILHVPYIDPEEPDFYSTYPKIGLKMFHGIAPNGGGQRVNQWTLIMDLYWGSRGVSPAAVVRTGRAPFFAATRDNAIHYGSFGESSGNYGSDELTAFPNVLKQHPIRTWARVIFTFDLSHSPNAVTKQYIDGVTGRQNLLPSNRNIDGTASLDSSIDLFANANGNFRRECFVSAIQIREGTTTDEEAEWLGTANADGIPTGNPPPKPPTITKQPVDTTVPAYGATNFVVVATGAEPLSYQWHFNDVDLAGQSSPTLLLTNVAPAAAGKYTVTVSNVAGVVTSSAATLTVLPPPELIVVNTLAGGAGSLPWAIDEANKRPDGGQITFNIPAENPKTILLDGGSGTTRLTIQKPVMIDGTTQPGYAGRPVVEILSGRTSLNGIKATASVTLRGLAINRFNIGADLAGGSRVQGCYFGIDPATLEAKADGNTGLRLTGNGSVIGGLNPEDRNLFAGKSSFNPLLQIGPGSEGNRIEGNWFHFTPAGVPVEGPLPGISVEGSWNIIGGVEPGARNHFSYLGSGVEISGANEGNRILNNSLGLTIDDQPLTAGRSRASAGIRVRSGTNTVIGGSGPNEGNIIANYNGGIGVVDAGTGTLIYGNRIGTDASGLVAQPNENGIRCSGKDTQIGGPDVGQRNLISGNAQTGVDAFSASKPRIQGNWVGIDATGLAPLPNSSAGAGSLRAGIQVGPGAIVGGSSPELRNIISGNKGDGIDLFGGVGTAQIFGNWIGLGVDGVTPLPNGGNGINIIAGAHTVGGLAPGEGNWIYYGLGHGILSSGANSLVIGNTIVSNKLAGIAFIQSTTAHDNEVYGNGGLAIDRLANGLDANKAGTRFNYPVITAAKLTLPEDGAPPSKRPILEIKGVLQGPAGFQRTIDFYLSTLSEGIGGELEKMVCQSTVICGANGEGVIELTCDVDPKVVEKLNIGQPGVSALVTPCTWSQARENSDTKGTPLTIEKAGSEPQTADLGIDLYRLAIAPVPLVDSRLTTHYEARVYHTGPAETANGVRIEFLLPGEANGIEEIKPPFEKDPAPATPLKYQQFQFEPGGPDTPGRLTIEADNMIRGETYSFQFRVQQTLKHPRPTPTPIIIIGTIAPPPGVGENPNKNLNRAELEAPIAADLGVGARLLRYVKSADTAEWQAVYEITVVNDGPDAFESVLVKCPHIESLLSGIDQGHLTLLGLLVERIEPGKSITFAVTMSDSAGVKNGRPSGEKASLAIGNLSDSDWYQPVNVQPDRVEGLELAPPPPLQFDVISSISNDWSPLGFNACLYGIHVTNSGTVPIPNPQIDLWLGGFHDPNQTPMLSGGPNSLSLGEWDPAGGTALLSLGAPLGPGASADFLLHTTQILDPNNVFGIGLDELAPLTLADHALVPDVEYPVGTGWFSAPYPVSAADPSKLSLNRGPDGATSLSWLSVTQNWVATVLKSAPSLDGTWTPLSPVQPDARGVCSTPLLSDKEEVFYRLEFEDPREPTAPIVTPPHRVIDEYGEHYHLTDRVGASVFGGRWTDDLYLNWFPETEGGDGKEPPKESIAIPEPAKDGKGYSFWVSSNDGFQKTSPQIGESDTSPKNPEIKPVKPAPKLNTWKQGEPARNPDATITLRTGEYRSALKSRPSTGVFISGVPNNESPWNGCAVTAVKNWLDWFALSRSPAIRLPEDLRDAEKLGKALGYDADGTSKNWPELKQKLLDDNHVPISTTHTASWEEAYQALAGQCAVEIRLTCVRNPGTEKERAIGHVAAVTGITRYPNGLYGVIVQDDVKQELKGGATTHLHIFDPNAGMGGVLWPPWFGNVVLFTEFVIECPKSN